MKSLYIDQFLDVFTLSFDCGTRIKMTTTSTLPYHNQRCLFFRLMNDPILLLERTKRPFTNALFSIWEKTTFDSISIHKQDFIGFWCSFQSNIVNAPWIQPRFIGLSQWQHFWNVELKLTRIFYCKCVSRLKKKG